MKILMLTWEFPPVVTGGLGMASYGIAKALLKKGVHIDLIIPASRPVYFPLRSEDDADRLPYRLASPDKEISQGGEALTIAVAALLGSGFGAYCVPGKSRHCAYPPSRREDNQSSGPDSAPLYLNSGMLPGENDLFREVNSYTSMAVNAAKNLDFDIIHAHDWLTLGAGMLLRNMLGKPLIAHIHSTEFDRAGGSGNGRIHRLEAEGISSADRIITVSRYTMQILREEYGADENRISVVHNAYAVRNIDKERKRIFSEPTVLFMGRITLQKGPDYFLETARRILQEEGNVRFIMAGKGDLENPIIHKSANLGMGSKFLFAGFLNRDEVGEILKAADIFVLPSVSEPFGIVCLEAMSYGTVAVISKRSGVSEVIESAIKVDFWDIDKIVATILELIRDPVKMDELSLRGMEEVEKLQWDESAGKIIRVYDELTRL